MHWEFEQISTQPSQFIIAPSHEHVLVERVIRWDISSDESYVVVLAPNPATRPPLDQEALKLEVESLRTDLDEFRERLTATSTRIAGAMASGALVVGLFAALAPEDKGLVGSILLAISAAPLLALILIAIYSPLDIEKQLEKARYPAKRTFRELAEKEREFRESPWLAFTDEPLSMATYEQAERRARVLTDEVQVSQSKAARVLPPAEDWLLIEIEKLVHFRADFETTLKFAQNRQQWALFLLGVLALYIVTIAVILQITD